MSFFKVQPIIPVTVEESFKTVKHARNTVSPTSDDSTTVRTDTLSDDDDTVQAEEPRRTRRVLAIPTYAEPGTREFNQKRAVLNKVETEKARKEWERQILVAPERRKKALKEIIEFFSKAPEKFQIRPTRNTRSQEEKEEDFMTLAMDRFRKRVDQTESPPSKTRKRKSEEEEEGSQKRRRGEKELSFRQKVELACTDAPLTQQKQFLEAGLYCTGPMAKFSWPLPEGKGLEMMDSLYNFRLPADLYQLYEGGILDDIRSTIYAVPPSKYEKIRKNIFVDRRPNAATEWPICACDPDDEVGCGETCLNRATFTECNPDLCPCGSKCTNQRFQRGERVKELDVFYTQTRGHGLKTRVDIPKGTLVIEYRGEIIDEDTLAERLKTNKNAVYFLNYGNGEVIDACLKGTEARFANHSCDPNCQIEKWWINGEFCVGLFALEDIQAGAELTYDYRFQSFGEKMKCWCGSKKCRGLMGENRKVEEEKTQVVSKKVLQNAEKRRTAQQTERLFWIRKQAIQNYPWIVKEAIRHRDYFKGNHLLLPRNIPLVASKFVDAEVPKRPIWNLPLVKPTSNPKARIHKIVKNLK